MDKNTAIKQLKELERLGGVKTMRLAAEEWREEWQTLIAILMSARTLDETTVEVGERLFKAYGTVKELSEASIADVERVINRVNFFQNKTKYVIGSAKMLHERYAGKPPHILEQLIELPGVGRKTANVFLAEYGHQAIGVDTHVAYVSRELGWTLHTDPKKIERDLVSLFPKKYWNKLNRTLVRFGKSYISRAKKSELLKAIRSHTIAGRKRF